jgi:hypothetical protein
MQNTRAYNKTTDYNHCLTLFFSSSRSKAGKYGGFTKAPGTTHGRGDRTIRDLNEKSADIFPDVKKFSRLQSRE